MIDISELLEFAQSKDYQSLATRLYEISQLVYPEYKIGFVQAATALISSLPEMVNVQDRGVYTTHMLRVMSSVSVDASHKLGMTPRDLPREFRPYMQRLNPAIPSNPSKIDLAAIQNDPMSPTDSESVLRSIHATGSTHTATDGLGNPGIPESNSEKSPRIAGTRAEGILSRVGFTNRTSTAPDWYLEVTGSASDEPARDAPSPGASEDKLNIMGGALPTDAFPPDAFSHMVNEHHAATSKRYQSIDSVLGLKGKLRSQEICRDLEETSRLLLTSVDLPIMPDPQAWDTCPRIYARDLLNNLLVDAINIICAFPAKLPYPIAKPYRSFTNEEASEAGLTVEYTGAIVARLVMEIAYIATKGTLPYVGKEKVSIERTAIACMAGLEVVQFKVVDKPLFLSAIWLFVTEACDEHVVGQLIVDSVVSVRSGLLKV